MEGVGRFSAPLDQAEYAGAARLGRVKVLEDERAEAQRPGSLLHIATHDPVLVNRLNAFITENAVPDSAYEYAMLYGIQRPLQLRLAQSGRRIRVLIAYGEYWFPWYMRRLAERPANVWFVAKNVGIVAALAAFTLLLASYRGVPVVGIILAVMFVIYAFVMRSTVFGRQVYAVGGGMRAAHLSGVDVRRTRTGAVVISVGYRLAER